MKNDQFVKVFGQKLAFKEVVLKELEIIKKKCLLRKRHNLLIRPKMNP